MAVYIRDLDVLKDVTVHGTISGNTIESVKIDSDTGNAAKGQLKLNSNTGKLRLGTDSGERELLVGPFPNTGDFPQDLLVPNQIHSLNYTPNEKEFFSLYSAYDYTAREGSGDASPTNKRPFLPKENVTFTHTTSAGTTSKTMVIPGMKGIIDWKNQTYTEYYQLFKFSSNQSFAYDIKVNHQWQAYKVAERRYVIRYNPLNGTRLAIPKNNDTLPDIITDQTPVVTFNELIKTKYPEFVSIDQEGFLCFAIESYSEEAALNSFAMDFLMAGMDPEGFPIPNIVLARLETPITYKSEELFKVTCLPGLNTFSCDNLGLKYNISNMNLQIKQGKSSDFPELCIGELGFASDNNTLYIGTANKNLEIITEQNLENKIYSVLKKNSIFLSKETQQDISDISLQK